MDIQKFIRTDQPLETGGGAVYLFRSLLASKYRFESRFEDEVLLHRIAGDKIILPRALCPIGKVDNRTDGIACVFPNEPKPRPNQVDAFKAVDAMIEDKKSGVIQAYTGFGKTVLGYRAAWKSGRRTLVITTKDDIYKQWIIGACGLEGKMNFLGLYPSEIGQIRGDTCTANGKPFSVAMIHSLSKENRYPDLDLSQFGLIIFDEVHRLPAEQFSGVADIFPARIRMGLSARPERPDGKELLIHAHVGPTLFKTEGELMIPKVLRFKTNFHHPRTTKEDKKTGERKVVKVAFEPGRTARLETMIAHDLERNQLIARIANMVYQKGRKMALFSTQIDHLENIHQQLVKIGITGRDIGFYIGATTVAEKEAREKAKVKPIMLTTYMMMGEGTSIDWLDTAMFAMGRSDILQPAGRVRREYPDKKEVVLIDLVDEDSPNFMGYAFNRMAWYKSIGATVKDMTI